METVNIEELVQDQHNFNKGTEEGARLMEKSFTELGAGRSILIDKDGHIIAGNKSQKAAMAAGIKKVRVIESDGTELIAVKRTDISIDSKEGRELALADNLTTQVNLAWDEAELESVAQEVGLDVAEWGLDLKQPVEDVEITEDNFDPDEEKIETVCKEGDLWQLGEHRLLCGDSTKVEDVKRLMQGETADLWLTDPPYNVAVQNSQGMTIKNDNMASDKFGEFLTDAFKAAKAVLSKGAPFYIWFASCEHINFETALNKAGLKVKQELVWNKNAFNLGRSHYQWKHEPCLYGWEGNTCRYFVDLRNLASVIQDEDELNIDKMTKGEMKALLHKIYEEKIPVTVINEAKPLKDADHPTMKPVRLFGYQTRNSSRPGEIVLDTFGGSGTTIVACEQLHRKARIMELDPHYCDVIIARWEKLTGKTATLINNN